MSWISLLSLKMTTTTDGTGGAGLVFKVELIDWQCNCAIGGMGVTSLSYRANITQTRAVRSPKTRVFGRYPFSNVWHLQYRLANGGTFNIKPTWQSSARPSIRSQSVFITAPVCGDWGFKLARDKTQMLQLTPDIACLNKYKTTIS